MFDNQKPFAILVDLDETLALLNGRDKHDKGKAQKDLVSGAVANLIHTYSTSCDVLVLTDRSESWNRKTTNWLNRNHLPYNGLMMKPEDEDIRYDNEALLKMKMLTSILEGYNVLFAVDDDPKCVEMYKAANIFCFQV